MRVITTDPDTCAALHQAYVDRIPVEFMGKKYIGTSGEFNAGFGPVGPKCCISMHIVSEVKWRGPEDGLPPVGLEIEVLNSGFANAAWEKCTILFIGKHVILYDSESCYERTGRIENLKFRPVRTPEQIAADERQTAIDQMLSDAQRPGNHMMSRFHAEDLYDAGYRRVQP